MAENDGSLHDIGATRGQLASTVRRDEPLLTELSRDIGIAAVLAVIWMAMPFEVSVEVRLLGGLLMLLTPPIDALLRRKLAIDWTNFAVLTVRMVLFASLAALAPSIWHPAAVAVMGVTAGSILFEPLRRTVAIGAMGVSAVSAVGYFRDVNGWYLSTATCLATMLVLWSWSKRWVRERREVDRRHDEMVDRARMFSWEIDAATGTIVSIAGNNNAVLGYDAVELEGSHVSKIVDISEARAVQRDEVHLREDAERHSIVTATHRDGHEVTLREVRLAPRREGVVRGVSIDISELAAASEALRFQAEHDALTGLSNRTIVEKAIDSALHLDDGCRVALLVADLDRFKDINDTLGHPTGDRLLHVLATRLASALDEFEVVARMGGDEFAFVAIGDFGPTQAVALGQRVHQLLSSPVSIDGMQLAVGASIGVAVSPDHGQTHEELLKCADIASYQAKHAGGGVALFESAPDELSVQRLELISETLTGLERGEFELHFQPQLDLETGRIVGAEGLARWRHPVRGILSPGVFFGAIEVGGNYHRFTDAMLRQAVDFASRLHRDGHELSVAVNLGSMSFLDRRLPETVARLLDQEGLEGGALTIEVTESDILDEQGRDAPVFSELSAIGVRLSIDDFGTGYSNFTRLRSLDVDEVKVDRAFVQGLGKTSEDAIIVRATIELAGLLGLDVVAEGVETAEQLEMLRDIGCGMAQGFFWSPAVHADDFMALLVNERVADLS